MVSCKPIRLCMDTAAALIWWEPLLARRHHDSFLGPGDRKLVETPNDLEQAGIGAVTSVLWLSEQHVLMRLLGS